MARRGEKMKNHNFYCSEELWERMKAHAEIADESDSEYIRNAIFMRVSSKQVHCYEEILGCDNMGDGTPQLGTISKQEIATAVNTAAKMGIKAEELFKRPKTEKRSQMVQSFLKK